jgi:chromate transport protein ChrA
VNLKGRAVKEANRRKPEVASVFLKLGALGYGGTALWAISISLLRLAPHAAPDAFAAGVLVLTLLALLAWRLPPLPSLLGGCLIGVLVRSRMFGLLPL